MAREPSFEDLIARLGRGEPETAEEVFRRFAGRLIGLARQRLEERIRQKVDPEDVMQSAFKSFFRRHAQGEYDLDGWGGLWALLAVITLRKCGHQVEYFHAARRDVRQEAVPPAGDSQASRQAPGATRPLRKPPCSPRRSSSCCAAWTNATAASWKGPCRVKRRSASAPN